MFHEYRDEVTTLKQSNAHFAKIFDEHNALDDEIKKVEIGEILKTDIELEILKKQKLALKDKAYAIIMEYRKNNS